MAKKKKSTKKDVPQEEIQEFQRRTEEIEAEKERKRRTRELKKKQKEKKKKRQRQEKMVAPVLFIIFWLVSWIVWVMSK